MGEIADGLINGDFDELTGEYIGQGSGYPRRAGGNGYGQAKKKKILDKTSSSGFLMELYNAQRLLVDEGYIIIEIRKIDYGYLLRTSTGQVVNIYQTGKINIQGKPDEKINKIF